MKPTIETITVVGAGAMGGAYASILFDWNPHCVSFLAAGDRFERLNREGLVVNGKSYAIPVLLPEDRSPFSDLVIVAVKHHQLPQAVQQMKSRIGAETTIMSVMNGIESEETIGAAYGREKVLYAVAVGIDALREGNRIRFTTQGKIFFGEAKNPSLTERIRRVQDLFTRAGIAFETPPDMIRTLWWKFMINVGINQASAVLGASYRVFQNSRGAQELMDSSMREVIALAGKAGVNLTEEDITSWYKVLSGLGPEGKTSMLQDVEAGRKTEVEMLAGKVIALGKQYGVPTPVNQELFDRIKRIESGQKSASPL
jgi:2-dehydropantoate 2-reductase